MLLTNERWRELAERWRTVCLYLAVAGTLVCTAEYLLHLYLFQQTANNGILGLNLDPYGPAPYGPAPHDELRPDLGLGLVAMQSDEEDYLHANFLQPARGHSEIVVGGRSFRHSLVLPGLDFKSDGQWRVWIETDMDGEVRTRGIFDASYTCNNKTYTRREEIFYRNGNIYNGRARRRGPNQVSGMVRRTRRQKEL